MQWPFRAFGSRAQGVYLVAVEGATSQRKRDGLRLKRIFERAHPATQAAGGGIVRAASVGATMTEIMEQAVEAVLKESAADRAAVWLESDECASAGGSPAAGFRGIVADRNGVATPAEWKRLPPEAPLVRELLVAGGAVEYELDGASNRLTLGVLLEMRKLACAPIKVQQLLRGLVFAGARNRQTVLDKAVLERVAAEMELAVHLREERRKARERQDDLAAMQKVVAGLVAGEPPDALLEKLTQSCTKTSEEFGPAAVFAAIGEKVGAHAISMTSADLPCAESDAAKIQPLVFPWRSGDPAWTAGIEREPLSGVWRQALASSRVTGSECSSGPSPDVSRLVALPLKADDEILGVLLVGLPHAYASLANLERLELRAALAAQALAKRKQASETQQRSNWDHALLDTAPFPLALLDAGRVTRINEDARRLLQKENNDSTAHPAGSQPLAELFPLRERQRIETWLAQTANGSRAKKIQEPIEADLADGSKVRLHALQTPQGSIAAVLFNPAQLAGRSPQEQRAEAELRSTVEWVEEGVVLFDAQQRIRAMNSRFVQMAGFTAEEIERARTLGDLVGLLAGQASEPEKFASRWLAVAHGSETGIRDEVQILRPAPRVLERATRPVLDSEGRRLGRVEIYRDLTAQRVFHSKLIRTEKLAALGQMVTSIAHELSNPLTSILGYAQRLLVRHDADTRVNEARQIFQEAERASAILRQLLLTARDARPERRKVPLNQVVMRTLELQQPGLSVEKIQTELDLDPTLPLVLGDAGQLQQVLMNLIGNARQAIAQTGKGGAIRIRTARAGGTHALLEVIDNGPGIPQAILARIFDPFFTTKPSGAGTGLGLSIVLGIVREHGGQVRVTSPPEGGATFSIELPAAQGREFPSPERTARAAPEEQDSTSASDAGSAEGAESDLAPWAGCAVLIVEDEATVAQLIADVLHDEGLEVHVLLDGREALRRAASEPYELVICDMKMPDLDGEKFYRTLVRAESPLRNRILFVTGDVLAAHTRQFLERHELPHLAKPFRVEELTEKVRQVLAEVSPRKARAARTKVARS